MSWKQGWFAVRASQEEAVRRVRAAEADAPSDAIPECFRLGTNDAWTSFDLEGGAAYGQVYDWAQAVSGQTDDGSGIVMGFFIFEGMWSWGCFLDGKHIAAMEGFPHRSPMLLGDIPHAAKLLGVPPELLSDYCVGYPFGDIDEERASDAELDQAYSGMEKLEDFRVRDGDEFAPWDEYGFNDFALRLGIPEPAIDELTCKTHGGEGWAQVKLSPKEDVVFTFDPVAFRAQHLG